MMRAHRGSVDMRRLRYFVAVCDHGGFSRAAQATGIAQVNEAVALLDTATQQNAALVEESAASAATLKQGALSMSRSVEVFQL